MFQQITIVGNLGRDPEMRYTSSGTAVTSFSVATNRSWTNKNGERVKETIWFRVSAWGAQAEPCNQYLHKGSKVLVIGQMTGDPDTGGPRIWTGQDGKPNASFEIKAGQVTFLDSKSEGGPAERKIDPEPIQDDLPF